MIYRFRKNYFLIICIFLILYFIFNLLDGNRGLFSYVKKKEELKNLNNDEQKYINKIIELEKRNTLLSEKLDKDFIEILIREKFLFGKENEKVYIITNNEN
jgi:cell division protein FtsB|tara:strand:- start:131 stop:433 length:303 start_codon:yes stop_codon:yes gene_type:complete